MHRKLCGLLLWLFSYPIVAQTLPLSTQGRWIVDAENRRFRLKSVNWYGSNLEGEVVEGLDKQDLTEIVKLIKSWGFNSIRLPFSNAMLHHGGSVSPERVQANPQLLGKSPLEVMDAVIKALTDEGLLVILNNHSSFSEWCCGFDDNGLWFYEGNSREKLSLNGWQQDWLSLVQRYKTNPRVVGADLRNEVRTMHFRGTILPDIPNWGKGDQRDWHKAAEDLGRLILDVNPNLLIVVEAINWEGLVPILGSGNRPFLRLVPELPIRLQMPNKLVYAIHSYAFIGPRHNGDDKTSKGQIRYGDMDEAALLRQWREEWSFVLDPAKYYTAPIWVSEFGVARGAVDEGERRWFHSLSKMLAENDLDFAYWPINHEGYGLVDETWSKKLDDDWRRADLMSILNPPTGQAIELTPLFTSLDVRRGDDNQSLDQSDWLPYSSKGTCPESYRLVGLSQDHRGLCRKDAVTVGAATVVEAIHESPATLGYDWAPGATKYECPEGFLAAGYGKEFWGSSGLYCRESPVAEHSNCQVLSLEKGDQRLSTGAGDFARGSFKAECAEDQFLGGIAQRNGLFVKALCCQGKLHF